MATGASRKPAAYWSGSLSTSRARRARVRGGCGGAVLSDGEPARGWRVTENTRQFFRASIVSGLAGRILSNKVAFFFMGTTSCGSCGQEAEKPHATEWHEALRRFRRMPMRRGWARQAVAFKAPIPTRDLDVEGPGPDLEIDSKSKGSRTRQPNGTPGRFSRLVTRLQSSQMAGAHDARMLS